MKRRRFNIGNMVEHTDHGTGEVICCGVMQTIGGKLIGYNVTADFGGKLITVYESVLKSRPDLNQ